MTKLFAIVVVILGFSATSFAQNSADGTALAVIQPGITIATGANLDFATIVLHGTAGTVEVSPLGVRITDLTTSGSVTAATFTVSGDIDETYTITTIADCIVSDGNDHFMDVTDFTSVPDFGVGAGVLDHDTGLQTIKVGATLNVDANQAAGSYSTANEGGSPFEVTVTYN